MKSNFLTVILSVLFLASTFTASFAQTDWTKYGNDPVLDVGPEGSWDDRFVGNCSVIFDSSTSTFKMWYNGGDGDWSGSIGYATSPDGINWTKYESNPVLDVGISGAWDDYFVGTPSVLLKDTTYHMWYAGVPDPSISQGQIGYAVSTDGISWQKDENNPVIEVGSAGSWEETWVYFPSVIFDGSTFQMWYTGTEGDPVTNLGWAERIGYATSPDGITWTKDANNPVLDLGSRGSWEDYLVASPYIYFGDSTYHMWYTGVNGNFRIGYANSPDAVTWTKDPINPVLPTGSISSWDYPRVQDSRIIFDGTTYHMWYSGGGMFTWRIGYATSPVSGINDDIIMSLPRQFVLSQNYPNPFNPRTNIQFSIPNSEFVTLKIYNLLGQRVATLVNKRQQAGYHQVEWNAGDLSSGVYYYVINAGEFHDVKKMILIR